MPAIVVECVVGAEPAGALPPARSLDPGAGADGREIETVDAQELLTGCVAANQR